MNPNPLLALNHLTVPCSLIDLLPFVLKLFVVLERLKDETNAGLNLRSQPIESKASGERQMRGDHNMPYRVRRPRFCCKGPSLEHTVVTGISRQEPERMTLRSNRS